MIPYVIEYVSPNDDIRDNNICTIYDCTKKNNLDETIINFIINFMHGFCNKTYGHNIKIKSFDNFCNQFWKETEYIIRGWYCIFRIYYFYKEEWVEWNIEEYSEQIYVAYVNKYDI